MRPTKIFKNLQKLVSLKYRLKLAQNNAAAILIRSESDLEYDEFT